MGGGERWHKGYKNVGSVGANNGGGVGVGEEGRKCAQRETGNKPMVGKGRGKLGTAVVQ